MRAHQIMTRNVITVSSDTSVVAAADILLRNHIHGLPVLDDAGGLIGIVSEGDILLRPEPAPAHRRARWLRFFTNPERFADTSGTGRGRKVRDVMTRDPIFIEEQTGVEELICLMQRNRIKRFPVLRDGRLVGIVSRSNLLQAIASMAQEMQDPTADDDHIRDRLLHTYEAAEWRPIGLQVVVRNGVVHLHGLIGDDRARRATMVVAEDTEGVKEVHDHICLVDSRSGHHMDDEDIEAAN